MGLRQKNISFDPAPALPLIQKFMKLRLLESRGLRKLSTKAAKIKGLLKRASCIHVPTMTCTVSLDLDVPSHALPNSLSNRLTTSIPTERTGPVISWRFAVSMSGGELRMEKSGKRQKCIVKSNKALSVRNRRCGMGCLCSKDKSFLPVSHAKCFVQTIRSTLSFFVFHVLGSHNRIW